MSPPAEAQGETLDRFRSYLYVLARAHLTPRTRRRLDASDLVQQTLMDAYRRRGEFRGATDAERAAWLRRILLNNLVDANRREHCAKRDASREQPLERAIDGSFRCAESWLAAMQPSPDEQVVQQEDQFRLAAALTELPDAQREAVILRHLQGLSLAEAASHLGRSEAAVAGLVYRGLNRLHESLAERPA